MSISVKANKNYAKYQSKWIRINPIQSNLLSPSIAYKEEDRTNGPQILFSKWAIKHNDKI